MAWPQPIGESQESVPSPTSPAARSRYAPPIAAPVMPYAVAVAWLTCIATAAMPANTTPTPVSDAPSASEPSAGWSSAIIANATTAPIRTCAPVATISAAASGTLRPTGAAPTSSLRPLCSSPRVWRPRKNMLISAANAAPNPPSCHATSPPTVVTSWGGPTIAISPGLLVTVAA